MIYVAILLVIVAMGVGALFLRDMASARARLSGRTEFLATLYGGVEYAVVGEGDPVLVVHGAGGGFDQGLDMVGPLAAFGYRLIAPSRFGYLGSALPDRLSTGMQADAYVTLLDHLGIKRAAVIGVSAGAWSCIEFASRHPERCRALVLLVPAEYLPEGMSIHGGAMVKAIIRSDFVAWSALKLRPLIPGGLTRMMLGTDVAVVLAAAPEEKKRLEQVLNNLLPVSSRSSGMQFDIKVAAAHKPYPLEQIACPVLTVSAEDDRFDTAARARFIAEKVKNGAAVIFPTGGHALVGRFNETLDTVVGFLKRNKG